MRLHRTTQCTIYKWLAWSTYIITAYNMLKYALASTACSYGINFSSYSSTHTWLHQCIYTYILFKTPHQTFLFAKTLIRLIFDNCWSNLFAIRLINFHSPKTAKQINLQSCVNPILFICCFFLYERPATHFGTNRK